MASTGNLRSMTLELKWGAPPPEALANPTQSSGFYYEIASALRAKPGEWAEIPRTFKSAESAKNTAVRIRSGRMAALPKGQFEALAHDAKLWMRYVEPEEGSEEQPAGPRLVQSQPGRVQGGASLSGQIRAWAKSNGFPDLPNHGRLPQNVIEAYHAAENEEQ